MAGLGGDVLASTPSPSPAAVQSAILNNCITLGAASALIYDYILTLPTELKIMWSHKTPLSGAKILFFLNRYCSLGYWLCLILKDFAPIRSELGCKVLFQFADAFIVVTNISILCIFLLRTYAIYHQSKVVLFGLGSIVIARIVTNMNVTYTQAFIAVSPVPSLPYTSSCAFHTKPSYDKWFLPDVCLFIIFDTSVLILTIARTIAAARTVSIAHGDNRHEEVASGSSGTSKETAVSSGSTSAGEMGKNGMGEGDGKDDGKGSIKRPGGNSSKKSSYERWRKNLNLNFRQNLCLLLLRDGVIYYSFIEFTWIYEICTQRIPGVPPSLKATNVTFQQALSSILVNRLVLNLRQAGRRDPAYTNASGSNDDTTDYEVPEFRVRSRRVKRSDGFDDDGDFDYDYEFDESRIGEGTWGAMSDGSTATYLRGESLSGDTKKEGDRGMDNEMNQEDNIIGNEVKKGGPLSLNINIPAPSSPSSPTTATTMDVDSPISLLPRHRQASGLDLWPTRKQIRKQRQQTYPIPSASSSQLPTSNLEQSPSVLSSRIAHPESRTQTQTQAQPRSRSRSNSQTNSPNRHNRTSPQSRAAPILSSAQERILGNLGMQVDDGLSEVFFGDELVRRWDRTTQLASTGTTAATTTLTATATRARTRKRRMRSGTVPGPNSRDPTSLAAIEEGIADLGGFELQADNGSDGLGRVTRGPDGNRGSSQQRGRARAASTSVDIQTETGFEMVGLGPSRDGARDEVIT